MPDRVIVSGKAFLPGEFRHRAGDGVVEASIEGAKVVGADGGMQLSRELGHRLADIAIVVHHLPDRQSLQEQITPVLARARQDVPRVGAGMLELSDDLVEEHRHAVIDLRGRGRRIDRPATLARQR